MHRVCEMTYDRKERVSKMRKIWDKTYMNWYTFTVKKRPDNVSDVSDVSDASIKKIGCFQFFKMLLFGK